MKASLAHEAPAHSPFGGSVAARVLRCPASVGLVERVPAHLRRSSAYAERGCALHSALALLLDDNGPSLESLVGKKIGDYVITDSDVESSLRPVFTYVEALLDTFGTEFYLERRVTFPDIANTFGTCDLIVRLGRAIHVIDFKFGAGVRVLALYPDGDEDVLNAQRHTGPLLDVGQFVGPAPAGPSFSIFAPPPAKEAYLQLLADELNLVDAVKDIGTALRDQAKSALESGDFVPGYALSADRAERDCHNDESAVIAALESLGLARDDVVATTMRSPKQVELRAKARGLRVPQELIVSHRSGVSLVKSENAHAPAPGRGEIARSFSEALKAFQEGGTHDPDS